MSQFCRSYPTGVDLVLDPQGGEDCARGISVLASGGRYVLYGSANIVSGETKSFFTMAKSWWQVEKVSPLKLFEENKTVGGLHLRHLLKGDKNEFIGKKLDKIWKLMAEGKINPIVDSNLNFREVRP
jgi:NADPH:quinone reductase-like Zn-dependent oxidoreductase